MKKFLSFILMVFMGIASVLTGCSLTQVDSEKYLNRVVASVVKDDEVIVSIKKKDLVNAYRNNASTYINTYGYTSEKTVQVILDNLINRELLILEAKKYVGDLKENVEYVTSYNKAVEAVFDYFDSSILTYENQLRVIRGLDKIEDKAEEDAETKEYAPYKEYEKKVLYFEETDSYELVSFDKETNSYKRKYDYVLVQNENGEYERFFYNDSTNQFDLSAKDKFVNTEKKNLNNYDYQAKNHGDAKLTEEAYNMFIKSLIKSEEGKNLSTNEKEVLQREFDRVMETYLGNEYVNLLEEIYSINLSLTQTNVNILNEYKNKVASSNAKYQELTDKNASTNAGYNQYSEDMKNKSSDVWYQPYGDKFVSVAHVLVKFTDAQVEELKQLELDHTNGLITTYDEYNAKRNAILNNAGTKARYTYVDLANGICEENQVGDEYGEVVSYMDIFAEIERAMNNCLTVEQKAIKFNEFVYKYSMDTGSMNQENYYVVNLDTNVKDAMVKEFADESRELYKQGAGSLSAPVLVESTNYSGYHIILALGCPQNIIDVNGLENFGAGQNFDGALKRLYETKVMLGTNKTIYDVLFDSVYKDSFSQYQTSVADTAKDGAEVKMYKKYYKDLI